MTIGDITRNITVDKLHKRTSETIIDSEVLLYVVIIVERLEIAYEEY